MSEFLKQLFFSFFSPPPPRNISCLEYACLFVLEKDFLFTVNGSYEQNQTLSLGSSLQPPRPLIFHYLKHGVAELHMALAEKKPHFCLVRDLLLE